MSEVGDCLFVCRCVSLARSGNIIKQQGDVALSPFIFSCCISKFFLTGFWNWEDNDLETWAVCKGHINETQKKNQVVIYEQILSWVVKKYNQRTKMTCLTITHGKTKNVITFFCADQDMKNSAHMVNGKVTYLFKDY